MVWGHQRRTGVSIVVTVVVASVILAGAGGPALGASVTTADATTTVEPTVVNAYATAPSPGETSITVEFDTGIEAGDGTGLSASDVEVYVREAGTSGFALYANSTDADRPIDSVIHAVGEDRALVTVEQVDELDPADELIVDVGPIRATAGGPTVDPGFEGVETGKTFRYSTDVHETVGTADTVYGGGPVLAVADGFAGDDTSVRVENVATGEVLVDDSTGEEDTALRFGTDEFETGASYRLTFDPPGSEDPVVKYFNVSDLNLTASTNVDASDFDTSESVTFDVTGSENLTSRPAAVRLLGPENVYLEGEFDANGTIDESYDVGQLPPGGYTVRVLDVETGVSTTAGEFAVGAAGENDPPLAIVGEDRTVDPGTVVELNASESVDPDGDALDYAWDQVGGPFVQLSDTETATAVFAAPQVDGTATLTFEVTVTDSDGASDTERVNITVQGEGDTNDPPTADVGEDRTVQSGEEVQFDATGSTDPDGDTLDYAWDQVGGPTVQLSDSETATPSFVAPAVDATTTFTFELTVTDGDGGSDTATVEITVAGDDGDDGDGEGPSRTLSSTTAAPGEDVTVTVEATLEDATASFDETFSPAFESASVESVTLDGEVADPVVSTAEESGAVVTLSGGAAGESATVEYTVTVPEDADPGTTYTIDGTVTTDQTEQLADDQITVSDSPLDGAAAEYDANGDGEIDIGELSAAATDYATGDLGIGGLSEVATAYAST